jgi:peptidoglycan/xylan/chitin deacetylase (PgdA/CDA1 family)
MKKILLLCGLMFSMAFGATFYDPNFIPQGEVVISTFSDSAQWPWQSPYNGARDYDTIKSHGVFTRGINISNTVNTTVSIEKQDTQIALMPDSCPVRVTAFTTTGISNSGGISITLYETDKSKYFQKTNMFKSDGDCNGKISTCLYKKQFAAINSPTWENIRYIRLALSAKAGKTMSLTFTKISYAPNKKGIVSVSFDDGRITQFTNAYPILLSRNIPAIFYIIVDRIGDSGYMTIPNLDTMTAHGMEIGSHTYSHKSLDTITSDTMLDNQLRLSYNWLSQHNYTGSRFFAYPWGRYSPSISSNVLRYYNFARSIGVQKGVSGGHLGEANPPAMNWNTNSCIDGTISLDSILRSVDSCVKVGGHAQLIFHDVLEDSAEWEALPQVYKDQGFANYVWKAKFAQIMDSLLVRQTNGKCDIKSFNQIFRTYKRYTP